jgi:hypothetical protein
MPNSGAYVERELFQDLGWFAVRRNLHPRDQLRQGGIVGNVANQVADFVFDLVEQHEGFGEVVEPGVDIGDTEDTQQFFLFADEHVVDFAPVGFGVDVDFRIDESGRLHRLVNRQVCCLEFQAAQVRHPLAE